MQSLSLHAASPLVDAMFLVGGNYSKSHVYRVGDDVIIDCFAIAKPEPNVTWNRGQQKITTTARIKVCFLTVLYIQQLIFQKQF